MKYFDKGIDVWMDTAENKLKIAACEIFKKWKGTGARVLTMTLKIATSYKT